MKRNLLKTIAGFLTAILGTGFLAKGLFFLAELFYIGINSKSILNMGYYSRIGMIYCDVAFYISVIFINIGIWLIYRGAKTAGVLKKQK